VNGTEEGMTAVEHSSNQCRFGECPASGGSLAKSVHSFLFSQDQGEIGGVEVMERETIEGNE
jgi:hypothetical protein